MFSMQMFGMHFSRSTSTLRMFPCPRTRHGPNGIIPNSVASLHLAPARKRHSTCAVALLTAVLKTNKKVFVSSPGELQRRVFQKRSWAFTSSHLVYTCTSYICTSYACTSCIFTSYVNTSHIFTSYSTSSHLASSHPMPAHPMPARLKASRLTASPLTSSHLTSAHLTSSRLTSSALTSSHLTSSLSLSFSLCLFPSLSLSFVSSLFSLLCRLISILA